MLRLTVHRAAVTNSVGAFLQDIKLTLLLYILVLLVPKWLCRRAKLSFLKLKADIYVAEPSCYDEAQWPVLKSREESI